MAPVPIEVQFVEHDPQACTSLVRSTHMTPLQFVSGAAQVLTQPVDTHWSPATQLMLHDVHVATFVRSASHPLVGSPSQSAYPGTQDAMTQAPPLHVEMAFGRLPGHGLHVSALHP
jgi:hypothetical protein